MVRDKLIMIAVLLVLTAVLAFPPFVLFMAMASR